MYAFVRDVRKHVLYVRWRAIVRYIVCILWRFIGVFCLFLVCSV